MAKRGRPPKKKKKEQEHPTDDEIINKICKQRNIQTSTKQGYHSTLKRYMECTGYPSFYDLIKEAREDEEKRLPPKKTRLKKHLDDYMVYLKENIRSNTTIHTYFSKLETIYRHLDITLPSRPPMKLDKQYHVSYFDLPDTQMIEEAVGTVDSPLREYIYFASSSGTAKTECLSITVEMFLDGLREYTRETEPYKAIKELKGRRDLVPLITLTRIKTNNPYYTCCSPEATYYLLEYLYHRDCNMHGHIKKEEPLFPMRGSYLMKKFQILNDEKGWGFVGPYRRFRTHTLRKFHASNLGCSAEIVDMLEGRSRNKMHATYIKQNPEKTKQVYMEYMHNVMIHPEDFSGPHCGKNWWEDKKNSFEEVDRRSKSIIMNDELAQQKAEIQSQGEMQMPVQVQNPQGVQPPRVSVQSNSSDIQSLVVQIQELTKQVGILEYRIQQLEQK